MADAQAQAVAALAEGGGEEGLEGALQNVRAHADTVIDDLQPAVLAIDPPGSQPYMARLAVTQAVLQRVAHQDVQGLVHGVGITVEFQVSWHLDLDGVAAAFGLRAAHHQRLPAQRCQREAPALLRVAALRHLAEVVDQAQRGVHAAHDHAQARMHGLGMLLQVGAAQRAGIQALLQARRMLAQRAHRQQRIAQRRVEFVRHAGHHRAQRGHAFLRAQLALHLAQALVGLRVVQRDGGVGTQRVEDQPRLGAEGLGLRRLHAHHAHQPRADGERREQHAALPASRLGAADALAAQGLILQQQDLALAGATGGQRDRVVQGKSGALDLAALVHAQRAFELLARGIEQVDRQAIDRQQRLHMCSQHLQRTAGVKLGRQLAADGAELVEDRAVALELLQPPGRGLCQAAQVLGFELRALGAELRVQGTRTLLGLQAVALLQRVHGALAQGKGLGMQTGRRVGPRGAPERGGPGLEVGQGGAVLKQRSIGLLGFFRPPLRKPRIRQQPAGTHAVHGHGPLFLHGQRFAKQGLGLGLAAQALQDLGALHPQ